MKNLFWLLAILLAAFSSLLAQTTIFFDSFENGSFDRTKWTPLPGPNGGIVDVVQGSAADGFYHVRMGKSSNGPDNTNELRLSLNLAGYRQVFLEFSLSDINDETGAFDAIFLSDNNGANLKKVYQLRPSDWFNRRWGKLPPIDVSGLAKDNGFALTSTFVISFKQQGTQAFNNDGFFLDAVHVYDPQTQYVAPPFFESFEELFPKLDGAWTWADPSYPLPGTAAASLVKIDAVVTITNQGFTAPDGVNALIMGVTDGADGVNAVDLHLNLAGKQNIELDFSSVAYLEFSRQPEDAIFFSDNGGRSFKRAMLWNIFSGLFLYWAKFPPIDVDRIAKDLSLALTDSFVIRFQTRSGPRALDGIRVYEPDLQYVNQYPFFDGFESGKLGNMWHWGNPNYPSLTAPNATTSTSSGVGVGNQKPFQGSFQGNIGNTIGFNSPQSNALDLHLDLSNPALRTVILSFQILDVADETDPYDAIFLSNDGGEKFVKIHQLEPSRWPNNVYQEISLDLTVLSAQAGLALTDKCVVRFQEYGMAGFTTQNTDGIRIDNVSIQVKPTAVSENDPQLVRDYSLYQNHPNPFNPATTIPFALPAAQEVTLKVFDLAGQEITTLLHNERKAAGVHEVKFDAHRLPSGVYFYRVTAGAFVATRKMVLVR